MILGAPGYIGIGGAPVSFGLGGAVGSVIIIARPGCYTVGIAIASIYSTGFDTMNCYTPTAEVAEATYAPLAELAQDYQASAEAVATYALTISRCCS